MSERGALKRRLKLGKVVPEIVRKYRTTSPLEIRNKILSDYNRVLTDNAITMFFKRHADLKAQLEKEIIAAENGYEEVHESLFQNGTFEQLDSVKTWIDQMNARVLSPKTIKGRVRTLKRICKGEGLRSQLKEQWSYKHPDRLTKEDCIRYISLLRQSEKNITEVRLTSRNFLQSKGRIVLRHEISGDKGEIGKYSKLYYPMEDLDRVLEKVKEVGNQISEGLGDKVNKCDKFMLKTATRINSSLKAKWSKISREDVKIPSIEIVDKGRHAKGREKWNKILSWELLEELEQIKGESDYIFEGLDYKTITEINREAITSTVKIPEGFKEWNHFWRHMFAQHMLRKTKWNYTIVAKLGGWKDETTLKQSYGMPPEEILKQWGLEFAF